MKYPTRWRMRNRLLLLRVIVLLPVLVASVALWSSPARGLESHAAKERKKTSKDYSPFPQPDSGYVTDLAAVLSPEEEERIERWLWQTESRSGVEIAVVTIKSISDYEGTPQNSIEAFAAQLFTKYGIGNMPKNDGILLLVAVGDRKARIELGAGYGLTRDSQSARIMEREILPFFRKDDYAGGITSGVKELMLEFAELRVGWNWPLILLIVGAIALIPICISLFKNGKQGWGWACVGLLIVLILGISYSVRQVMVHMPKGHSSSWSSGGFGGGFGGGFSGGGGATGSW
jgi:uncharacterized protein